MKKLLAGMHHRTKWKSFLGIRKAKRIPKYDHVDLYLDREHSILIVPQSLCELGSKVNLDHPYLLSSQFPKAELGSTLRDALAYAQEHPFLAKKDSTDVWAKATDVSSWEDFARNRYKIIAFINENAEFVLRFCYRDVFENETYFRPRSKDPEFNSFVDSRVSDEELADAILELFHKGIAHFEPGFFETISTDNNNVAEDNANNGIQDGPLPFGYKMSWLTLKSSSSDEVFKVLGCSSASPVSWRMGLDEADIMGETTFVSEPIGEYVLAIGVGDLSLEELNKLAENFEDVQYYLTERVVDYQAWAHFHEGSLDRAYKFIGESGEVLWDEGEQVQAEKDLGLTGLPTMNGDWPDKTTFPTESHIIDLAAHFSVDPLFRDASYPKQSGYLCSR